MADSGLGGTWLLYAGGTSRRRIENKAQKVKLGEFTAYAAVGSPSHVPKSNAGGPLQAGNVAKSDGNG
jgi:hypothetical protein